MESIFVTDEDNNNTVAGKASFPEYPAENPTKSIAISWCDTWYDNLTEIGCSALLRGEVCWTC